jgi:hypothetical protein
MDQTHVAPTVPPPPTVAADASEWTGGRIAALVIGALLGLISLGFLGAAGVGLWADLTQREGGYVTTGVHKFSTAGSALATERFKLGSPGVGWLYGPGLLGKVRIRVTPSSPGQPLFVGIGRSKDVDRYLAGANRTLITDWFGNKAKPIAGGAVRSAPTAQRFWVASDTGRGERTLLWRPRDGSWSVVVMKADGRPGVDVGTDLGARMSALPWIALGCLVAGAVFMAGGVLLIVGAIRRRTS